MKPEIVEDEEIFFDAAVENLKPAVVIRDKQDVSEEEVCSLLHSFRV